MKRKASLTITIIGTIGLLCTIIARAINGDSNPLANALGSFRYFTIQSNLIVVVYFWILFSLKPKSKIFDSSLGAVVVYITITFIIFATFLEPTWSPRGLDLIGSLLNHYITPILVIAFVISYRKDYTFSPKVIPYWLAYPLLYLIFVIIYGSVTNDYFYPFFDISNIGLSSFIMNAFGLLIFFTLLSLGVSLLTRKKARD